MINNDLTKLSTESKRHFLSINPSKSIVLVFGKHKSKVENELQIKIEDTILPFAKVVRNLGIELDSELRFKQHVTKCIQKSYANLKMLFPHRHSLNISVKILLCDTLILSHFNYCDSVYGPCIDNIDFNRIQRVQKSCLRFIYGIRKYDRITHKLRDAKWLNMSSRRKLHMATLFHKIIPVCFKGLFL